MPPTKRSASLLGDNLLEINAGSPGAAPMPEGGQIVNVNDRNNMQEIFDLMGATTDDGVMFGEFGVEYHGTLRAGATYECDAEVTDVERKRGRRAGVFDKLSFEVTIREPGCDAPVAVCRNAWIFPRGDGDA